MHESLVLLWQMYFAENPTEKLLQEYSLLRDYEEEMIDGPVADLGCGQGDVLLLNFIKTDRKIYAIDNEQFMLDMLKERVLGSSNSKPENWEFLSLDLEKQEIPDNVYSLVICSNIFHFFDKPKGIEIGQSIANKTTTGSLVYLQVHSTKHPSYRPGSDTEFSHFFTLEDIDSIFNNTEFERIYTADIQRAPTKEQREFTNRWLDKWLEKNGKTNPQYIKNHKANYFKDSLQAYYTVILRRR
jgi:SAM-dependent methyltransferase